MTDEQMLQRINEVERRQNDRHTENVERMTKIETILSNVYQRLFGGDGVKGIVAITDARIAKLEKLAYCLMGAVAFVELVRGARDFFSWVKP